MYAGGSGQTEGSRDRSQAQYEGRVLMEGWMSDEDAAAFREGLRDQANASPPANEPPTARPKREAEPD